MRGKDCPLEVLIENDELVIRIGIDVLAHAAHWSPTLERFNESTNEYEHPKVTNNAGFASEVAVALRAEREDGATPVHDLLDGAMQSAIDDGAQHILMPKEPRP